MKTILLSICLFLSLNVSCQWNLNSRILSTNIPYDCTGITLQLGGNFTSPHTAYYSYYRPQCSPTSASIFAFFYSDDSCRTWYSTGFSQGCYDTFYDTIFTSGISYPISFYKRSLDSGHHIWAGFTTYPGQYNVPTTISVYNGRYGYGYGHDVFYRLDHDTCYQLYNYNKPINWRIFKFLSDSLGFSSNQDTLFRTGNGGLSWDTVLIDTSIIFLDINWITDSIGLATVNSNIIYKTNDYGKTWNKIQTGLNYILQSICNYGTDTIYSFHNPDNIYHDSTAFAILLKSADCGLHWDSVPFMNGYMIKQFRMFSENLGYIFAYKFGNYFFFQTKTGMLINVDEVQKTTNNIFPNPFTDRINIKTNESKYTIQISDCLGKVVYSNKFNDELENVIYPGLSSGVYFLQLTGLTISKTTKLIRVEN